MKTKELIAPTRKKEGEVGIHISIVKGSRKAEEREHNRNTQTHTKRENLMGALETGIIKDRKVGRKLCFAVEYNV